MSHRQARLQTAPTERDAVSNRAYGTRFGEARLQTAPTGFDLVRRGFKPRLRDLIWRSAVANRAYGI